MNKFYVLFLCMVLSKILIAQPVLLDPATHPKFQNPLPSPSKINVGSTTTIMQMAQTTQWLGLVSPNNTQLQTTVWGYGLNSSSVSYPGPTLVANSHNLVNVEWRNNLPTQHLLPVDPTYHAALPASGIPTVTHLHGGHTEAASDGHPDAWYTSNYAEKGSAWTKSVYQYDNTQEGATLWYHDHALGTTRLNVYAGLAGFYLLNDANDQAVNLPRNAYDREIVIQDRMFDNTGQLYLPTDPDVNNGGMPEFFGDFIVVNGMVWPHMSVEPRQYRLRLLNGSDSRVYELSLSNGASFLQIATDDGKFNTPVSKTKLLISPGERAEIIIDFSTMNGQQITLLNTGTDAPYGNPDSPIADPNTTGQIMQFRVNLPLNNAIPNTNITTSTNLRPNLGVIQDIGAENQVRKLALFEGTDDLGRIMPMLGIFDPTNPNNGSLTWHDPVTENVKLNDTEIWEIYNTTADAHPVHLHLVAFQILSKQTFDMTLTPKDQMLHNGAMGTGWVLSQATLTGVPTNFSPAESGWKDTHILLPGEMMRIKAKFDRTGDYVWHCHILSHEDHDMMRKLIVGNQCIKDVTPPVLHNCPSNITLTTTTNCATATWTPPTVTDDCTPTPTVSFTTSPTTGLTNGDCYPIGTTTVTYMAMDNNNNMSTCSFTVTVQNTNPCSNDITPPTIHSCPSNINLTTADHCATVNWTAPTATDNCSTPTISFTTSPTSGLTNGGCFPIGTTNVTYTATDAKGNKSTCSFIVNITSTANCNNDVTPPVFETCPANILLNTNGSCAVADWVTPVAIDNCVAPTVTQTSGLASGSCFPIGATTITYMAMDAKNNMSTCSFTVTVTQPGGSCTNNLLTNPGFENGLTGWYAGSNTVAVGNTANSGTKALEICTGSGSASQLVPASPNKTYTLNFYGKIANISYAAISFEFKDANFALINYDPAINQKAINTTNYSPYTLTLTAPAGTAYIQVALFAGAGGCVFVDDFCLSEQGANPCSNDVTPPVLSPCPANISLTTSGTTATASWTAPTATDNCGTPIVSFTTSPTSGLTNGGAFPIGTTTVTYMAMDAKNNMSTCSFTVTVTSSSPCTNDVTPPVLSPCPANISLTTSGNTATASWTAPTATDNCSTPTVSFTTSPTSGLTNGGAFPIGTTTVTYMAMDAKNNMSTCSFTVTVTQSGGSCTNNLLTNPGFENGLTGWYAGSNTVAVGNTANSGTKALEICNGSGFASQLVSASPNKTYTLNFYGKIANISYAAISFEFKDANFALINYDPAVNQKAITATSYSPYTLTLTAPAGTAYIQVALFAGAGGCVFVDDFCLSEQGANPCSNDVTPPVLSPCPANISLTTSGNTATASWTAPTATDNCGTPIVSFTTSPTSGLTNGGAFPIGTTTVTYMAMDAKNNMSTCSFTVTVTSSSPCTNDVTPPVLSPCPANISLTTSGNTATASWTAPTATDNCSTPIVSFTTSPTSGLTNGGAFPIGTTTVTYMAMDAKNNMSSCSFTVTVTQSGGSCTNNLLTNPGFENGLTGWYAGSNTVAVGNTANSGTKALEICNGSGFASQLVPASPNKTYTLNFYGKIANISYAAISFEFKDANFALLNYDPAVNQKAITATSYSPYTLTLTAPAGTAYIQVALFAGAGGCVFVDDFCLSEQGANPCSNDVTPPVLSPCPANISLTTSGTTATASWTAPTATDNCGTPIVSFTTSPTSGLTNGGAFPIGTTTVTYMAMDAKNNMSSCSFTVTVTSSSPCTNDVTPPVLSSCPANISLTTSGTTATASWTAPTATDNCSTPTVSFTTSPTSGLTNGSAFPIGTTTVTYTATDAKGNKATCSFTVTVTKLDPCTNDATPPVLSPCPANISLTTSGTTATASWTAPTATDNCSTPTVSFTTSPTSGLTNGGAFPIGTTTVTYTATDAKGNKATCSFTVTVTKLDPCTNDATPPVLSACPANISLTTSGTTAIASWTAPKATDNCGTPTVSFTTSPTSGLTNGGAFPIGTTTVTYTATDAKGNKATCSFTVTVTKTGGVLGDFVWVDTNGNGLQDAGEPGISGVQVQLLSSTRTLLATTTTDANGKYSFTGLSANTYILKYQTPAGYSITLRDANSNLSNTIDSDIDANGEDIVVLATNEINNTKDAGYKPDPCYNETVPPTITGCPSSINLSTTGTSAVASWSTPVATDNCGTPILTSTHTSGSSFPVGTTTVTYTATDSKGNKSTCSFSVIVTKQCGSALGITNGAGGGNGTIGLYQSFVGKYGCQVVGKTAETSETSCTYSPNLSTTLTIPAGSTVKAAYILWTASGADDRTIYLNGSTVTATRNFSNSFYGNLQYYYYYGHSADVTNIVKSSGTYSVTDLQFETTKYCSVYGMVAGFSLIVVYENAQLPISQINLYDGFVSTFPGSFTPTTISMNLTGIKTSTCTTPKVDMTLLAWEGDSYKGEYLYLDGTNVGNNTLSGSTSPDLDIDTYNVTSYAADGTVNVKLQTYWVGNALEYSLFNAFVTRSVLDPTGATLSPLNKKETILALEATNDYNRAKIQWVNNTTENNDYFIVQKLNPQTKDYVDLKVVNAVFNKAELESYLEYDNTPSEGDNYYRIKLVSKDATVTYSDVKKLTFGKIEAVNIFPNPVDDQLNIDLNAYKNSAVTIYMYNHLGQIIQSKYVDKVDNSIVTLNVNNVLSGQYLIRIVSKDKKDFNKKINVTH